MKQTPNLKLNKPDGTDVVNIEDLNANMDTLDAKMGTAGHNHNGSAGNGPKISYSNLTDTPASMVPTAHASTATTYGVSSAINYGHAMASSAVPLDAGTANAGIDNGKYAREGHVHPAQTSVSGNAATATKLQTARTINGVAFDGSADINITQVNGKDIATVDQCSVSIGTIMPFLATKAQPGWLALDTGALVSRATYPDLWAWVQANAPLITEAAWQAQAAVQTSVGCYSSGDGSTTFRLPRLLDYLRGGLAADVGRWQEDAIRNITGSIINSSGTFGGILSHASASRTVSGAFAAINKSYGAHGDVSNGSFDITFDASKVVPTADENRPKTIRFLYCVKAFDAPTNQGLIDITQLANEIAGITNTLSTMIPKVSILTGTISSGGTIPLPSGYTQDQCRWMVSPKIFQHNSSNFNGFECSVDSNRIVKAQTYASGSILDQNINYIIIGVK